MAGVIARVSCVSGLGPPVRMGSKVVATVRRGAAFYAAKVKPNLYPIKAYASTRVTKLSVLNPVTLPITRIAVHVIPNPTGVNPPPERTGGGFHWS